ncbi:MAG: helix-turn-helix domain-containing protein [Burkholderiaceae bacterium]
MIPPTDVGFDWEQRAARLRQARVDQGFSLSAVAARLAVSVTELAAIEAANFQYFDSAQRVQLFLTRLEAILQPPIPDCGQFIPKFLRDDLSP